MKILYRTSIFSFIVRTNTKSEIYVQMGSWLRLLVVTCRTAFTY